MTIKVALVGRRLADNENLGLGYLAAALEQAGIRHELLVLNDVCEIEPVARAILQSGASMVGLSLPDGGSALPALALGEVLRAQGFRGHITCGGPFATLARSWLLTRYGWLDSVIRFAGERPLVGLVRALDHADPVQSVAGVTTREGDGLPAAVCDLPLELVPRRGATLSILGWGAAHILATRGCEGRCTYCGPAALQVQELHEGRCAGHSLARLQQAGVGSVRRRKVADVCEEVAGLFHKRSVRYFYFVDEHVLPYGEAEALEWIDALASGLKSRGVGRLGFGAMLRADRLTLPVVEAFARAGLLRAFLGIEFGSAEAARRFGRRTSLDHACRLLESLRALDVAVVSNLMIVHPYATPASVQQDLDFLDKAPAGVFEATRMMVYQGTSLCDRLAAEGRLQGNPLRLGYRFDDPVMGRFADIHTRLRAEAFWDHSLAYRTHDAWLAARLARQMRDRCLPGRVGQELEAVRVEVNRLYAESLRTALALAQQGAGAWDCTSLVLGARDRSVKLLGRLDRCVSSIQEAAGCSSRLFSPLRAAAASALVFSMAGTPACGGKTLSGGEPVTGSDASTDVQADTQPGKDSSSPEAEAGKDAGAEAGKDANVACTPDELASERSGVQQSALAAAPCFAGWVDYQQGTLQTYFTTSGSMSFSFTPCTSPTNQAKTDGWTALAQAAASEAFAPCLLKEPYDQLSIDGGAGEESAAMAAAVQAQCPGATYSNFMVIVDATGTVTDVQPQAGATVSPDILACVKSALAGLTFPCYAGMTVCPEYAIAE